jgi:uncharacterized cupin superfamily protein
VGNDDHRQRSSRATRREDLMAKKTHLLRAEELAKTPEFEFHHPFNPATVVFMRSLGDATSLERLGVRIVRVPPRHESFPYHCHYDEEEFVYVLSGRGILDVGEETFEIGPGDFMGFPAGPIAHQIRNPHDADLTYLTGGERKTTSEIADFPKHRKRVVRVGKEAMVADFDDLELLWKFE